MEYFEVPEVNPGQDGLCSDNDCPCGYPGATIPRGKGYMYISQSVVDFRKDAKSVFEAEMKMNRMRAQSGGMILFDQNVVTSTLMCEQGARKRGLDLEVAAADARYWWETHLVPLRATPLARSKAPAPSPHKVSTAAEAMSATAATASPLGAVYPAVSAQPPSPLVSMCWFCQQHKPGDLHRYDVVLNKTVSGQQLSKTVTLMRCSSCRDIHIKHAPRENTIIITGLLLSTAICFLISLTANKEIGFWAWVIGVIVGFLGIGIAVTISSSVQKKRAARLGTRSAGQVSEHPEVSALTTSGWTINAGQTGAKTV